MATAAMMSTTSEPRESAFATASKASVRPNGFARPFRFSLRGMMLYVAAICILLTLAVVITTEIQRVQYGIGDHYAISEVTDMISHYYRTHEGTFPSEWDDMRPDYEFVDQGYGLGSGGLEQLQRRVSVNFDLLSNTWHVKDSAVSAGSTPDVWFIRIRRRQKSTVLQDAEQWANERIETLVRHVPSQRAKGLE